MYLFWFGSCLFSLNQGESWFPLTEFGPGPGPVAVFLMEEKISCCFNLLSVFSSADSVLPPAGLAEHQIIWWSVLVWSRPSPALHQDWGVSSDSLGSGLIQTLVYQLDLKHLICSFVVWNLYSSILLLSNCFKSSLIQISGFYILTVF